jgi:hypothetical protein
MMRKVCSFTIVFVLLASSLIIAATVQAEVPKPSIPEMTITLVEDAVQLTIKNQPYHTYNDSEDHVITLYYHIRMKDHYEDFWQYTTYPIPVSYRLPDYFPASKSEFTTMDIPYTEHSIGFDGRNFRYPSGQVDFEVEAFMGYSTVIGIDGSMSDPDDYFYFFKGEASGWSDTQTITIASPQYTPTPQPTAPPTPTPKWLTGFLEGINWETAAIALLIVAVLILAVGLGVVWRRLASFKNPNAANL